jgi:hypothetical protein
MPLTAQQISAITPNDANMYFAHTYPRLKNQNTGTWERVKVIGFTGNSPSFATVLPATSETKKVKKETDTISIATLKGDTHKSLLGNEWDFSLPEAKVYNFKGTAVIFRRLPFRQNRKGFGHETFDFEPALFPWIKKGVIPPEMWAKHSFSWDLESVNLILEQMSDIPLQKSVESIIKQQAFARAVGDHVILSQGVLNKNPTLWYDSKLIGEWNIKKDIVTLIRPEFYDEIVTPFETDLGLQVSIH